MKNRDEENSNCVLVGQSMSKMNILDVAKNLNENGTDIEKEYLYKVHEGLILREECLSDVWIGHQRFSFLLILSLQVHLNGVLI